MRFTKQDRKDFYRILLCLIMAVIISGTWKTDANATDCIVTAKSLSMNFTSLPQAQVPIDFTAEAVSGCGGSVYYFFTYTPDYGTSSYDASRFWVNMTTGSQTVSFTNSNTVRYSFATAGYYIVVVDVSPSASFPPIRNIIGCSVAVQENSGGGNDCSFQATALNLTVTNALTGAAISGATASVMGQTATTNSSGAAAFINLPTNQDVAVVVSATGFITQTTQVRLVCGQTQSQGIALLSSSNSGVISGDIRVIVTWGENPRDLDTHLTGPKTDSSTNRFHVYYSAKNNTNGAASNATIPAWLDVDDTSSFGPETVTINKISGSFIPGTYRYYIHHYSGSSNIPNSGAAVQLYKGSTLIRSFAPPSASSSQTVGDDWVWSVFEMALAADGTYTLTTPGTYSGPHTASDTSIFRGPAEDPSSSLSDESSCLPEVYRIFPDLPEKD